MTKDEIARVINPEYPWVYAPTTAPTKIILNDGHILVGYFQYTQISEHLQNKNIYTFVEFGENASLYRATGDPKYISRVNGDSIAAVEYPSSRERDISLDTLMRKIGALLLEFERRNLTSHEAILSALQFRLDWGFHIHGGSNEFSPGDTKELLAEGLLQPRSDTWKANNLSDSSKMTLLLEEFLLMNKLTEKQILDLYGFISGIQTGFRNREITIHKRQPGNFQFTSAIEVPSAISSLVNWYNASMASSTTNPVILAGIFHYRLVSIHPFLDGNGRLARVITSMILLKYKIPPPRLNLKKRIYYLAALEKADAGDYEGWIRYFATEVMNSMEKLLLQISDK